MWQSRCQQEQGRHWWPYLSRNITVDWGDQLAALVAEAGMIDLLDGAPGEARLLLLDFLQVALWGDAVVAPDGEEPLPAGAGIHRMHPRKPTHIAPDDTAHGVQDSWGCYYVAVPRLLSVLLVAPQRISIADAMRPVPNSVLVASSTKGWGSLMGTPTLSLNAATASSLMGAYRWFNPSPRPLRSIISSRILTHESMELHKAQMTPLRLGKRAVRPCPQAIWGHVLFHKGSRFEV